jgi:hypothetical protein
MKVRLSLAAALGILTLGGTAAAQQTWLQDRRYGEGIGIRAGNLELHPGVSAEFGYDSNFFQRAEDETADGVVDAWRLRVTPSISLSTFKDRRLGTGTTEMPLLRFSANAFFAYSELFGDDNVSDQRNFSAGVGGTAEIASDRPFGADLFANYLRSGEPSNSPVLDQAFDRSTTNAGLLLAWRPGGGLLDWRLGYEFMYNSFEENAYDELNNFQHSIVTRGRWRFLPRTALRYDGRYTMVRYQVNTVQPDGEFVEARVGLAGLLTSQVGFQAMVGWLSSFYDDPPAGSNATPGQDYDGIVAHGSVTWFTAPTATTDTVPAGLSSVTAGYLRDFSNSYLGSFYVRDRGYLKLEYFLGGVFLTQLEGGFSRYSFPESGNDTFRIDSFTQSRIDAKLFGEYRMSDTFAVNLTFMYDQALEPSDPVGSTGVPVGTDPAGNVAYDDLRFSRFQAYLGLRLFW